MLLEIPKQAILLLRLIIFSAIWPHLDTMSLEQVLAISRYPMDLNGLNESLPNIFVTCDPLIPSFCFLLLDASFC